MKRVTYILAAMAFSLVMVSCSRNNTPRSANNSDNSEKVDTSKLKDVTESKAVPDEILAAVSTGSEQKMLEGFDESVGGVIQRKVTNDKVYVVVTASLGQLPETDKYNVSLSDGKVSTVIGALSKVAENQYQLKYAGPVSISKSNTVEVKQVGTGKVIFTGSL